jgi:hypothetical protein
VTDQGNRPAPTEALPVAGWYPDKDMYNTLRLWDGKKWTDQMVPGLPMPSGRREGPGGWVFFGIMVGIVGVAMSALVFTESVNVAILIMGVTSIAANAAIFVGVVAKGVQVGMSAHSARK